MVEPKSALGQLLVILVQEVALQSPMAFKNLDLALAIKQADNLIED